MSKVIMAQTILIPDDLIAGRSSNTVKNVCT